MIPSREPHQESLSRCARESPSFRMGPVVSKIVAIRVALARARAHQSTYRPFSVDGDGVRFNAPAVASTSSTRVQRACDVVNAFAESL